MAVYKVKLGAADGQVLERQTHGGSGEEIRRNFQSEGYYVFSVTRAFDPLSAFGLGRRIPTRRFIAFNKELRGLIRAGLPIVEGLDITLKRMREDRLKSLLVQVRRRLTHGESLSQAFAAFPGAVPRYYPALIHAGEQSGGMVESLDRFIEQEERLRKARKRFRQALTYPALLIIVAAAAMYVILTRAMPQFAALYEGGQRDLPALTRAAMGLSDWFAAYRWHTLIALAAVVIGSWLFFQTERGARLSERLLSATPLAGSLWRLHNQNIFARVMRLLIAGGVPVPQAVAITAEAVPSRALGRQLQQVHEDLMGGDSLQDALDRRAKLGDTAGELLRVGEATGSLGEMFAHIADDGEELAEDKLELISNLVAPLVLLAVGLLIAVLIVAMYLPMFGGYQSILN